MMKKYKRLDWGRRKRDLKTKLADMAAL